MQPLWGKLSMSEEPENPSDEDSGRYDSQAVLGLDRDRIPTLAEWQSVVDRLGRVDDELNYKRGELMDLSRELSGTRFDLSTREGALQQTERKLEIAEKELAELRESLEQARDAEERATRENEQALREKELAEQGEERIIREINHWHKQVTLDWKGWFEGETLTVDTSGVRHPVLLEVDALRRRIRQELDAIEPIWLAHGKGVQKQLEDEHRQLEIEIEELRVRKSDQKADSAELENTLNSLRRDIDDQIRRAQHSSRAGLFVEIPERLEAMVIAQDRELTFLRMLIERVEYIEKVIAGHSRTKYFKEISLDLEEMRRRFSDILEEFHVEPFRVEPDSALQLSQQDSVTILERKGWGNREFIEQAFQPGIVDRVIRPGYRIKESGKDCILRPVEITLANSSAHEE